MQWDSKDRRYEDEDGNPLSPSEIRAEIAEFIALEQADVKAESAKLFAREITVAEFFAFMRQKITNWHSVSGAIAYGGEGEMTPERWKRINEKILSELTYLEEFEAATERSFQAAEILAARVAASVTPEKGPEVRERVADALLQSAPSEAEGIVNKIVKEAIGDAALVSAIVLTPSIVSSLIGGTVESRAASYTEATWATHENNVLARETDEGGILGRRVLEAGDNCEDCIAASSDEFVPLDELPEIGDSACGSRCRCEFEFSDGDGSFRTSELFSGVVSGQDRYGGDVEIN